MSIEAMYCKMMTCIEVNKLQWRYQLTGLAVGVSVGMDVGTTVGATVGNAKRLWRKYREKIKRDRFIDVAYKNLRV